MGKHEHLEPVVCVHALKYCKKCDVVYCEKCEKEWKAVGINEDWKKLMDEAQKKVEEGPRRDPWKKNWPPFEPSRWPHTKREFIQEVHTHGEA